MKETIAKISMLIIMAILILNIPKLINNKRLDNIKENNVNKKQFAMYKREIGGEYEEVKDTNKFPINSYKLNKDKTICLDNNKEKVEATFSFYKGKVSLTSNKTVYCTLYFDAYFNGEGTESKPYQIQNIEDLVNLSNLVNEGNAFTGKEFILERDLDFKDTSSYEDATRVDYGDINGNGIVENILTEITTGSGFIPIGNATNMFSGNFNGQENKINNIYINNGTNERSSGLFGRINNSNISNLTITGIIKTAKPADIGAIVGGTYGNSSIINCNNDASLTSELGKYSIGGIVGGNLGILTIKNTHNTGIVVNSNNAGGLIGINHETLTIDNSYNEGEITNTKGTYVGGLLGRDNAETNSTIIANSYNKGIIISNTDTEKAVNVGGLIGYIKGNLSINSSYNLKDVKNNRSSYSSSYDISIGGLVGRISSSNVNTIENSYNNGIISNGNRVGGIVGYLTDSTGKLIINNCYNSNKINTTLIVNTNVTAVGGIEGYSYGNIYILNSYNNGAVSNIVSASGGYQAGGIVGRINDGKGVILNSYNVGNVSASSQEAGGIIGYVHNDGAVVINNVFSKATIISGDSTTRSYGISYIGTSSTYSVQNAYYLNTATSKGSNITTASEGNVISTTSITDALFKGAATSTTSLTYILNHNSINLTNIESSLSRYTLSSWSLDGTKGYPVLNN